MLFEDLPSLPGDPSRSEIHDMVQEVGGTATGMALLQAMTIQPASYSSPAAVLAAPAQHVQPKGFIWSDRPAMQEHGWAIKLSGVEEAFSSNSRRGRDSSNGRRIAQGSTASNADQKMSEVWEGRPAGTVRLALQQLINFTDRHALVYLDICPELTWLEYVQGLSRLLVAYDPHWREVYREKCGPDGLWPSPDQISCLRACMEDFQSRLGRMIPRLNLEGVFADSDTGLQLLQLRPVPGDRPYDEIGLTPPTPFYGDRCVWRTRFVWGAFDLFLDAWQPVDPGTNVMIRTSPERSFTDGDRLSAEVGPGGLLLIDTVSGFRLTHEPWYLPPVGKRQGYAFMHVPQRILDAYPGNSLRIFSNGDCGFAYLA
jgi:hypothetical protein